RRLERRRGGVGGVGVERVVVADRLDEARDVGRVDRSRQLRVIPLVQVGDRLSGHWGSLPSRRLSRAATPSSRRSSRSSTSASWRATPATWAREGSPNAWSRVSADSSPAFLTGPWGGGHRSR